MLFLINLQGNKDKKLIGEWTMLTTGEESRQRAEGKSTTTQKRMNRDDKKRKKSNREKIYERGQTKF